MKKKPPEFNCEKFYDSEVIPLAKPLVDYCKEHGLPLFIAVCYASSEDGAAFGTIGCGGQEKFYPRELKLCRAVVNGSAFPMPVSSMVDLVEAAASVMQHVPDPDIAKN